MNLEANGNDEGATVVIFSQHILGLGTRKTSMVFFAEALARRGWNVKFVTVQLSYLSYLAKNPRLIEVPAGNLNKWQWRGDNLHNYVWVPLLHPATFPTRFLNRATSFFATLYPLLLDHAIKKEVAGAQLVIIESCAAVALFTRLKKIAPRAKFVHFSNDRLHAIGMHPILEKIQQQTAPLYDLIRTIATGHLAHFPTNARVEYIPQGLDKRTFDVATESPYASSTVNIVIAGDMAFDAHAVQAVLEYHPGVDIHFFGRTRPENLLAYRNFRYHGEVPFSELLPYIKHADIGFAPYSARPGLEYLAESSLKMIQYSYARLPIVAPYFVKGVRSHVFAYDPTEPSTAASATSEALTYDRTRIETAEILDWDEMTSMVLHRVGGAAAVPAALRRPHAATDQPDS